MTVNRRKFIKGITAVAASIPFTGTLAETVSGQPVKKFPISFFTKPLDGYEFQFINETLALAGIKGLEPTVRPKGLIEPEKVAEDLPRLIESGQKSGLKTEMMVTAITRTDEPFTRKVLETATRLGVKHYRLGYYDFDYKKGIVGSLEEISRHMKALAQLNKETGIQGGYQNHTGTRFGGPVWDIWEAVKTLPAEYIGCQFDICHAVTEGAFSWINGLHLMKTHIGSLAIKDFTWEVSRGKAKINRIPLGEGIVDFDFYFKTLKELKIVAPITLHVEYPLLTTEEEGLPLLQKQKIMAAKIKKDVDFIRSYLDKYQLTAS